MKSLATLYTGYRKVAGLFFSKKKCPIHANPYPSTGIAIKKLKLWKSKAASKESMASPLPIK
jgi:hypothetical protein